jgi:Tfp pilus assembly protein PilO
VKKWPEQHRIFFVLFSFALILCGVVYFFTIRPLYIQNLEDEKNISKTKSEIKGKGWPIDSVRLNKLLDHKKNILEKKQDGQTAYKATGLKNKSNLLLMECTDVFKRKIKKLFVNPADFSKEITRLDYQDEYNKVKDELASRNIYFSEESLGLGGDSDENLIYPLVLQIWMVEDIVKIALDNSLQVLQEENTNVKNEKGILKNVVSVKLLPIKPYSLYTTDKKIYIIEFPMRMSIRGTLTEFIGFLRDMHSDGKYFPISRLQIRAIPEYKNINSKFYLTNEVLDIEIECSAFFRKSEDTPVKKKKKKINIIPVGA